MRSSGRVQRSGGYLGDMSVVEGGIGDGHQWLESGFHVASFRGETIPWIVERGKFDRRI